MEDFLQVLGMLFLGFAFDLYVVNVYLYRVTDQRLEDFSHQLLVSGSNVFELEWHDLVTVEFVQRYEDSIFFVCRSPRDLMVSGEDI